MIHQSVKQIIGAVVGLGVAVALCVFVYLMTNNKIVFGYDQDYQPTQPIPFSHKIHAGKLGINCKYCHTTAEVSRHATVPSLNICMNCHIQVRTMDGKPNPWIDKVVQAYNSKTPIQWVRVHMLPDFVKFNHAPHILAGKQCQDCHGPVQEMDVVKQWAPLSMGWCVNCHRKPENHAPTTCGTCHY